MNESDLPAMLTVEELASFLRIGRSLAYELCRQNQFPIIHIGRNIRINRESLLKWLSQSNQTLKN